MPSSDKGANAHGAHSTDVTDGTGTQEGTGRAHKAGAFDMRNFIAALIGIYGIVLVIYGLVGSNDEQTAKAGGVQINLWAGLGMVVVAALFLVWARLRPVIVPADATGADDEQHH